MEISCFDGVWDNDILFQRLYIEFLFQRPLVDSCFDGPWWIPVPKAHGGFLFPRLMVDSCSHGPWWIPVPTASGGFLF